MSSGEPTGPSPPVPLAIAPRAPTACEERNGDPGSTTVAPSTLGQRVRVFWQTAARTARLMIGLPDYRAYLAHHRLAHPQTEPMSEAAFFRSRQDARYRRGSSRCC